MTTTNPHICTVRAVFVSGTGTSSKIFEDFKKSLSLIVAYDFSAEKIRLSLDHDSNLKYKVESLDVQYDFSKTKLETCIINEYIYESSIKEVNRHILHKQISCTIIFKKSSGCLLEQAEKITAKFEFDVPYFQSETKIMIQKLETHETPEEIEKLFDQNFKENDEMSGKERELLENIMSKKLDRLDILKCALYVENLTSQQEMKSFVVSDIQIDMVGYESSSRIFTFRFKVKDKLLPPKVQETSMYFYPMTAGKAQKELLLRNSNIAKAMVKKLLKAEGEYSWIEFTLFSLTTTCILSTSQRYFVRFVPNDITLQACLKAIASISSNTLKEYFAGFVYMPPNSNLSARLTVYKDSDFVWCNKNIETNEEQKLAIKNIVKSTAFPFPYCVFGPPGTGKTSCVIECVMQILRLKPTSRIFLTAQSNSACNEIGERLLQFLDIRKVFRLYSSRLFDSNSGAISSKLISSSNLRDSKKSIFPSREELGYFPVVISTVSTSSQLDRALLHNYFDYIFIDECAATNEPEACIPIVGLGCQQEKITANIILIGDPKQLPPVVSSKFAGDHLGLGVSLMERVMTTRRYQENPQYDSNYIIQLLDNYRSHPSILHFSNVEFYNSKLRAKRNDEEIMIATTWKQLPNMNFPVLFHCEKTPSTMKGKSSYNEGEMRIVQEYVNKLLNEGLGKKKKVLGKDIGIVTPYKAQSEMLKKLLPKEIEVGTSEYYQGREKLIMILSTVRSKTSIGFVSDERRLNVCLTRAKALMIVVGNGKTLQQNKLWCRFIKYCKDNNACVGAEFTIKNLKNPIDKKDAEIEKPCKVDSDKDDGEDQKDWNLEFEEYHQQLTKEVCKKLEDLKLR